MNAKILGDSLVLKNRFFWLLHLALRSLVPITVFSIVVFLQTPALAYMLVLLSKWRIIVDKPRFWWQNLQINAVDLIFSLSVVFFISLSAVGLTEQLIWLAAYFIWIFVLKSPRLTHGQPLRGLVAQALGSSALFYSVGYISLPLILAGIWFVALFSSRHVLKSLSKEVYRIDLTYIWGLFSLQLAWVLLHWQVNFWIFPNFTIIQTEILIAATILYALYKKNVLPARLARQVTLSALIIAAAVIILSGVYPVSI